MDSVGCGDIECVRGQRAAARDRQLVRRRVEHERNVSKKQGIVVSTTPRCHKNSTPNRMVRKVVRSCISSGRMEGSVDIPPMSLGTVGSRKPGTCHRFLPQMYSDLEFDHAGFDADLEPDHVDAKPCVLINSIQQNDVSSVVSTDIESESNSDATTHQHLESVIPEELSQDLLDIGKDKATTSKEEVLAALVEGLKMQRLDAEQRANGIEKQLEESEGRLKVLEFGISKNVVKSIKLSCKRPASALTLRDARQLESQRVRKQMRKDDQQRRQEHAKQLVVNKMRLEAENECTQSLDQAKADVAKMRSQAKSHARAHKIAAQRESAKILQDAQVTAEEQSQRRIEAATEVARQRLEAAERLAAQQLQAAEEQRMSAERLVAKEQHTAETLAAEARVAAEKRLVTEGRNAVEEKRGEVLVALIEALKQQRQHAEQRAQLAEEKVQEAAEELRKNEITCRKQSMKACAKYLPLITGVKAAKQLERQRASRQNKVDDKQRRQTQTKQRLVDEARSEAHLECEKQMDTARSEIARMKLQAKSALRKHSRTRQGAIREERIHMLESAQREAEAIVQQARAEASVSECPADNLVAHTLIQCETTSELPLDLETAVEEAKVFPKDAEQVLGDSEMEDAGQWQLLPDVEAVDDSWDVVG